MENEIELKIMLEAQNIVPITQWLAMQRVLDESETALGNTYFDTPEQYFALNQMGFRVRSKNQHYEMTLKTKGEIVGGLHIRPEYNLPLENEKPDFKRLISHFNLQIEQAEQVSANLQPTFSTDFLRHQWLIEINKSQIEVVLDQGEVKNPFGSEKICELEFELKTGALADIFQLIEQMPKLNGMWLSSLSKAQRGYIVGRPERFKQEILQAVKKEKNYTLEQQLADYLRLYPDEEIYQIFVHEFSEFKRYKVVELQEYLKMRNYLDKNINTLKEIANIR
ncbi:CYTH domain-containing protein [Haemophilus parahaemolyticus]|uniref:CYTH domain-containing protein n=2 Tax=Haemophilus parahaemolyticus TaxID=735 RepID=A0AAE6MPM4_HAEPH|nr:CYTH domain-containing protein [Haemophilus parahaemolyticus]EIJ67898.1 adenylate cyclase [Haemophilus parahaemolyticus HK385]OOR97270.1 adenylate cyclase [Haemophilus parahaemolyticus]QEN11444.1 CYTH domain-containing protein [Haemophilus parahaemolyticus]QRP12644.1 CYTH domain-containing protein [Haemophilus parahaemolyticus]STO66556.1 adenylate cyclase [Haemophilus parahaemolyticus HK385]